MLDGALLGTFTEAPCDVHRSGSKPPLAIVRWIPLAGSSPLVARQRPGGFQRPGLALRHLREQDRRFGDIGYRGLGHGERERQCIRGVDPEVNFVAQPVHDLFPRFPVLIFALLGLAARVGTKVPTPVERLVLVGVLRQGRKRFPLDGKSLGKMGQSGPERFNEVINHRVEDGFGVEEVR